jgi:hypothetical protein
MMNTIQAAAVFCSDLHEGSAPRLSLSSIQTYVINTILQTAEENVKRLKLFQATYVRRTVVQIERDHKQDDNNYSRAITVQKM